MDIRAKFLAVGPHVWGHGDTIKEAQKNCACGVQEQHLILFVYDHDPDCTAKGPFVDDFGRAQVPGPILIERKLKEPWKRIK